MFKLIDCHSHVNSEFFKGEYPEVLKRAFEAGVAVINVGTNLKDSEENVKIAEKFEGSVWATVGVHPSETDFSTQGGLKDYDFLKKMAENEKVVAIGECGLDYKELKVKSEKLKVEEVDKINFDFKKEKERQVKLFKEQIRLAKEVGKPLMLHVRTEEAWQKIIEILEEESNLPKFICHFFSGDLEQAKKILKMGGYFTFGGVITFSRDYDEIVKEIPLEAIMLETDSPFVAPEPYRGQKNRPEYVVEVAKKVAEIKEVSLEEVAEKTTETAKKVFKIKV